jgi:hypothetical protein
LKYRSSPLAYQWITSEAEEKTGKYIHSALKQLEQQLGVHAVVLVTYQDTEGEVKISEYVYSKHNVAQPKIFKALSHREYQQRIGLDPTTLKR